MQLSDAGKVYYTVGINE